MTPVYSLLIVLGYFVLLIAVAFATSGKGDSEAFFKANKSSPWFLVAFGMIGTSLSGVTFISVPGKVGVDGFQYFQIVLGYILGYWVIGAILLPLYYKLHLVSIYTFLKDRFGQEAYTTGAVYFLISRTLGSAARFYLAMGVLHWAIFSHLGVGFLTTSAIGFGLIWLYTFRGGMKTIVITDTFQSACLIAAAFLGFYFLAESLGNSFGKQVSVVWESSYSTIFNWDFLSPKFFGKQFLAGTFIAIVMTGLDQDMMQKNLTCKSLKDAQKNMFWFTIILVVVNFLFLVLGASLFMFANQKGIAIPPQTDQLFPIIAMEHLPSIAGVVFLLGIVAATYASTDSALAALTTSVCYDFLGFGEKEIKGNETKVRIWVHFIFTLILLSCVALFHWLNESAVIDLVFKLAGYTYGPLLGLFGFGLFSKRVVVKHKSIPVICILAPLLTYLIVENSDLLLGGYKFGFELLLLNGALTASGLFFFSSKQAQPSTL